MRHRRTATWDAILTEDGLKVGRKLSELKKDGEDIRRCLKFHSTYTEEPSLTGALLMYTLFNEWVGRLSLPYRQGSKSSEVYTAGSHSPLRPRAGNWTRCAGCKKAQVLNHHAISLLSFACALRPPQRPRLHLITLLCPCHLS